MARALPWGLVAALWLPAAALAQEGELAGETMGVGVSLVIVFVVITLVAAIAFSAYTMLFPEQTAADRLQALTAASETGFEEIDLTGENRERSPLEQIAERLGGLITQGDDKMDAATQEIEEQLRYAGYRNRRGVEIFYGIQLGSTLMLPVLLAPLAFVMTIGAAALAMVCGAGFGYVAPKIILASRASGRQGELLRSLPDALDLLVSSVESGLSLDQAFKRVAYEMQSVAPGLAREFTYVNNEISAGVERLVAMTHLYERTGLEDIKSLVNMLAQSERFGSSVADSLRTYSEVAREKRMSRAEEKAGAVGSKLTVVMIVFFLPVLMVILLAPSAIRIVLGQE